jgi:two-component system sensor histidine kinase VicK
MNGIRFFRTIQVKLIIIYVLLILIAMQLIGVYFISTMKTSLTSTFTRNMNEQANLLSEFASQTLSGKPDKSGPTGEQTTEEDLNMLVRSLFSINEAEIQERYWLPRCRPISRMSARRTHPLPSAGPCRGFGIMKMK